MRTVYAYCHKYALTCICEVEKKIVYIKVMRRQPQIMQLWAGSTLECYVFFERLPYILKWQEKGPL